jgi:hypothetical protein
MTLRLGRAIGGGVRRALTPAGVALMVLTAGYTTILVGAVNTIVLAALPPAVRDRAEIGLVFPLSPAAAGVLVAASLVVGMVVVLAAARAFTAGGGSRLAEYVTRRMGRALVSAIGANLVVSVAVMVGFVLLIVPGLFLAVSFTFIVFAIAVDDARAIPALRRSWALARGHRWRLLAIVLLIGVVTGLVGSVGSLVTLVDPTAGEVVSLVVTAPFSVLG